MMPPTERQIISYKDFPQVFENDILPDENLGLFYGHLSTARGSLLDEMILYKYTKVDIGEADVPPLGDRHPCGGDRHIGGTHILARPSYQAWSFHRSRPLSGTGHEECTERTNGVCACR